MEQVDYKEKYEEIIKNLKEAKKSMGGYTFSSVVDKIIPELQESEDERIRKAIIRIVKMWTNSVPTVDGIPVETLIDWLEKRGELKPVDKVEPKFKVGDWITSTCGGITFQIIKIENEYYIADDGDKVFIKLIDKNYHLWTIQDAKNGDVLAAHECLVLFKEIDGLNIKCNCTYHYMNYAKFYVNTLHNKTAFYPATKEQRDLLFSKMKEAGYYWDYEKKELKRIEREKRRIDKDIEYEKRREEANKLAEQKEIERSIEILRNAGYDVV